MTALLVMTLICLGCAVLVWGPLLLVMHVSDRIHAAREDGILHGRLSTLDSLGIEHDSYGNITGECEVWTPSGPDADDMWDHRTFGTPGLFGPYCGGNDGPWNVNSDGKPVTWVTGKANDWV